MLLGAPRPSSEEIASLPWGQEALVIWTEIAWKWDEPTEAEQLPRGTCEPEAQTRAPASIIPARLVAARGTWQSRKSQVAGGCAAQVTSDFF